MSRLEGDPVHSSEVEAADLEWQRLWDEYHKPVRQSVEELLMPGEDLMTMSSEEVDDLYLQVSVRRHDIGRMFFHPGVSGGLYRLIP